MSEPVTILHGDVIEQLRTLPDESVQCCVTSPPYYGLRSYLKADDPAKVHEIGAEETPDAYVARMVEVFREVRRVLRSDGTLWLNLGDSYLSGRGMSGGAHKYAEGTHTADEKNPARRFGLRPTDVPIPGFKPKDLLLIPSRVAMALQADGWYLRSAGPWIKRNAMPESVNDRPSTTIETVFLLSKSDRYHYDATAVRVAAVKGAAGSQFHTGKTATHQQGRSSTKPRVEDGTRLRRSSDWFMESWQGMLQDEEGDPLAFVVNTRPYRAAHFAVFPPDLVRPCIQAGTSAQGCCPTCGAPHRRIVESKRVPDRPNRVQGREGDTIGEAHGADGRAGNRCRVESTTLGWEQTCACEAQPPVPCVVLDPFGGSGTTAQVALEQGCHAIVVELNADYIPLIRQRCGLDEQRPAA